MVVSGMGYTRARVAEVLDLAPSVKMYILELPRPLGSQPGQYVMVWLPGVGEFPVSVAGEKGGVVRLVVARKGRATGYMHERVAEGGYVFVRGPLGRGFRLDARKALLVGGGYGAAPLLYLAERLSGAGTTVHAVLGFRSREHALLVEDFRRVAGEVWVATEDGSEGFKGTAVDLFERVFPGGGYDAVYTCGKELMMEKVVRRAVEAGVRVQASLERIIKCGVGVCGACALEPLGLRVCSDGPVFDGETLLSLEDFGRYWRDHSGRRVPLPP